MSAMPVSEKRKEIRDGNVAILYSPGHGAGWYTWNVIRGSGEWDSAWLMYDAQIVHLVEEKQKCDSKTIAYENWVSRIREYAELNYPGIYTGGADDLCIMWLPVDTKFFIHEYDGAEYIQTIHNTDWLTA